MKSIKCIFLFTLLANISYKQTNAQVIKDTLPWCPPGATWVYASFSVGSKLYYKFTYEKDTVINQTTTKKLLVKEIEYLGWGNDWRRNEQKAGEEYLYESNDSVYWYDKVNSSFFFIYSFNPKLGDELLLSNSRIRCYHDSVVPKPDTLVVTNLYADTFSNRVYNAYSTSINKRFILGDVVEGIGCLQSPFPVANNGYLTDSNSTRRICDAEYGEMYNGLQCYFDSLRGYVQFQSGDTECATYTGIDETVLLDERIENIYTLYPNPVNSFVTIKSNKQIIKQICIYNTLGGLVFSSNDETTNFLIDLTDLKSGIYWVKITDKYDHIAVLKFVKN